MTDFIYKDGGFYTVKIDPKTDEAIIPDGGVLVTEEEHTLLFEGQNEGKQIVVDTTNGKPILQDPPEPTVDEVKASYTDQSVQKTSEILEGFIVDYTEAERHSWGQKVEIAQAYKNGTAQPVLVAEAKVRGITVADLADKILAKNDTFMMLSAVIGGVKNKALDDIQALATAEAIEARYAQFEIDIVTEINKLTEEK